MTSDKPSAQDQAAVATPSLMRLPALNAGSAQNFQRNMADLLEGVVQTNLLTTQEMFRATTPDALIQLQQRFVRDYMTALFRGTAALVAAIHETAEQSPQA